MITATNAEQARSTTVARLPYANWAARASEHEARADALTRDHIARRSRGEKHPVEDFLFTYYNLKPAQLRRWHPGAGIALEDPGQRRAWKWYSVIADTSLSTATPDLGTEVREVREVATVDAADFLQRRGATVDYIDTLLSRTLDRTPSFGCFGLHEWAMVYKLSSDEIRHRGLPLRLGSLDTDVVVETNPIRCSHFDAYRFFTPEAAPLNELAPTRENQTETDQAGCLHAGMDVYKWAMKLGPLIPGELLLDCFELARDIRVVDMQASPYDVSAFGLPPIPIETVTGKQEYAERQRRFAARGNKLRVRVIDAISLARSHA